MSSFRIFGIGNRWRRDDAAGPATAGIIREMQLPGVFVREECDGGTAILNAWDPSDSVYMIDAAVSGAKPGTIHRLDALEGHITSDIFPCSTHDLGAAEVAEFARALGRLPRQLVLYGIEGADFDHGEGMTPEVAAACRKAAVEIRREIEAAGRAEGAAPGAGRQPDARRSPHSSTSSTERGHHA